MVINVLLAHVNTGEEMLIDVPSDWQFWQIYRYVRDHYPRYCFVESW